MGAYDLGELGPAQVASSGLQGLLEAYKIKLGQATEEAKIKQSGYNSFAANEMSGLRLDETIRSHMANERLKQQGEDAKDTTPAHEVEIGGIRYLSRAGGRGQRILTPVINQKGSATGATNAQGNIAAINQAPEYLKALKEVPGGNLGIRATQTPVIGSLFGLINAKAANAREKRKAFVTPYMSDGGGKSLTKPEQEIFQGRLNESSLVGDGTSTHGIQDLVQEIAGKTGSAIDTNAMGPATGELRTALDAAILKARAGGAMPGGEDAGGGWQTTTYRGKPARRRPAPGGGWEVEVAD